MTYPNKFSKLFGARSLSERKKLGSFHNKNIYNTNRLKSAVKSIDG